MHAIAGNWPGAFSTSRRARRYVNKFPIFEDGEKVEKNVRSIDDVYTVGLSPSDGRQCPEALPTSQKVKNSADLSGNFNFEVNLADASPIIIKKKTLFLSADAPIIDDKSPTNRRDYPELVGTSSPAHRSGYVRLAFTRE